MWEGVIEWWSWQDRDNSEAENNPGWDVWLEPNINRALEAKPGSTS